MKTEEQQSVINKNPKVNPQKLQAVLKTIGQLRNSGIVAKGYRLDPPFGEHVKNKKIADH